MKNRVYMMVSKAKEKNPTGKERRELSGQGRSP